MTQPHPVLFLRDFDSYNRCAIMPDFGSKIEMLDFAQGRPSADCRGSFWIQGQTFFAFACIDGKLYVRIGDVVFELSENVTIDTHGTPPNRTLVVVRDGVPYLSMPYLLGGEGGGSSDETPFVEDEDFDFGLLLSNISHSEERKKIILEQR